MRSTRLVVALLAVAALAIPAPAAASPSVSLTTLSSTPGTAWWTDPATGKRVVAIDDSVSATTTATLRTAAGREGATVVRERGVLRQHIAGGNLFYAPGGFRCVVGFNARSGSTYYFMTSAHCVGAVGSTVYANPAATTVLGVVHAKVSNYDYAIIRYTNTLIAKPSAVDIGGGVLHPIRSFGNGVVGQTVQRYGPTTGLRSGRITALNATVNYAEGTVYGLIRTNVCSEPGDSGGPLFQNTVGLGMLSGGSGNCTTGGTTYFSSALRAATAYGIGAY